MPLPSEEGADDPLCSALEFVPRAISVDVRKFSGYVLVPGHESGEDPIFLDHLGFRARNAEDAEALMAAYLERAICNRRRRVRTRRIHRVWPSMYHRDTHSGSSHSLRLVAAAEWRARTRHAVLRICTAFPRGIVMKFPLLGLVRLTSDRSLNRGVGRGAVGTIVLLHDDAYEVEFSRLDGTTIDWFTVRPEDLELIADAPDANQLRRVG